MEMVDSYSGVSQKDSTQTLILAGQHFTPSLTHSLTHSLRAHIYITTRTGTDVSSW